MALDLSGATPPPTRPGTSGSKRRTSSKAYEEALAEKRAERADGVNGLFQLGAFGFVMAGQVADAGACAEHGPRIANEAAALAEQNERVAKVVDYVTAIGPFAALFAAVMPFGLQLLLNHGRIPYVPMLAGMGVLPAEMMEQRAAIEQQRQAAAMHEAMREAQAELARQEAQTRAAAEAQRNAA